MFLLENHININHLHPCQHRGTSPTRHSQRIQGEKMNKYCKDNRIKITRTIFEDHSVKSDIESQVIAQLLEALMYGSKMLFANPFQ